MSYRLCTKVLRASLINTLLISILLPFVCIANDDLPAWVSKPTADTPQFLFGIGSGESFDGAKNSALSDIASKFNVQVEAMYIAQQTISNDRLNNNVKIDTKVKVQPTALTQFQISNTQKNNALYWVEVKLDRVKLARDLTQTWLNLDITLQDKMITLENTHSLQALVSINPLSALVNNARIQLTQIDFAVPSEQIKEHFSRYREYSKKLDEIPRRLDIRLETQNSEHRAISVITNVLLSKGLKLRNDKSEQINTLPSSIVSIVVSRDEQQGNRDAYITQLDVQFTTRASLGNKITGSSVFKSSGRDYDSPERAYKKALAALKGKLSKQEMVDLLNIEPIR